MREVVVNQIVLTIRAKVKEAKDKLLTEENGRQVASLQGKVFGFRQLLENMAKEYGHMGTFLDYHGDDDAKPADLSGLSDEEAFRLETQVDYLKTSEEWARVQDRIDIRIGELKDHLLYGAEKSRELDIAQGQYKAFCLPAGFFGDVKNVANTRRQRIEEAAKRKREELDFGTTPAAPSGPTQPAAPDEVHQAGEELISSTCPSCGGSCYRGENNEEPCETCGATGVVYQKTPRDTRETCPDCKGAGNVQGLDLAWGSCLTCRGSGKVEAPEPMFIVVDDSVPTKTEFLIDQQDGQWGWTDDLTLALAMSERVAQEAARQAGGRVVPALGFTLDVSVPINPEEIEDDEPEPRESKEVPAEPVSQETVDQAPDEDPNGREE